MDAGQWTMDHGLAAAVLAIAGLIAAGVCWASLWGRHHEACRPAGQLTTEATEATEKRGGVA